MPNIIISIIIPAFILTFHKQYFYYLELKSQFGALHQKIIGEFARMVLIL
jgi:hypothetical protein